MPFRLLACLLAISLFVQNERAVRADELPPLRIGLLVTLSGPGAVLGQQARDGFQLFVAQHKGKLGGRAAQVVVVDDEMKPDLAPARVQKLLDNDHVDFVVGSIFPNILAAIFKPVTNSHALLISPGAGPAMFAGAACSPNFFVTSYETSQIPSALGKYAQDKGYKRVFLIAPKDQPGKDALAAFKSAFKGEVADEDLVPPNQLDFLGDLTRITPARADVIFAALPGASGTAWVKQFHQSGQAEKLPFLSAFTIDEATLPAQQEAAIGLLGGMTWAVGLDTPANLKFVEEYLNAYHSIPGSHAMQGFDAAQAIDAALAHTQGSTSDHDKLRAAMRRADFNSPRGKFRFNNNGYPVQDFYLVKAAKRPDGLYETDIVQKLLSDSADGFAAECPLKADEK